MTDAFTRLAAALADRYRIERELGEGGMATVYLAEDLKHDRQVAIKVLKPELAAVLGADRFVQEIKTTAALQHPNILPLFDSGEADGFLYYVMPYVQGESLRDKLDRERQLGVDEAVALVREVADGLEYAHQHGVVHRDIKPENILIHAGRPMVADFGIALAVSAAAGGRMTETGLSLGTPHYMSPEQATAEKTITNRSDVYSLASVLYEMLSGDPPHTGATAQQIIVKIIADEARPVEEVRKSVPPNVAAAVSHALEKLPADRFETAKAFGRALADPAFRSSGRDVGGAGARSPWNRLSVGLAALAGVLAVVALGAGLALRSRISGAGPVMQFEVTLPPYLTPSFGNGVNFDVSPDGSKVVFAGLDSAGTQSLWLRASDQIAPVRLLGTDGARNVRFSPDGRSVAYTVGNSLSTVSPGTPPLTVVPDSVTGLAWGSDGYLYYRRVSGGIWRVPAGGGKSERVLAAGSGGNEGWFDALPNGKGLLFSTTVLGDPTQSQVAVLNLRTGEVKVLLRATMARFAPPGDLLYATAQGQLLSVPFDVRHLRLAGPPRPVLDGIRINLGSASYFAASASGALLYGTGGTPSQPTLVWLSADGSTAALPLPSQVGLVSHPSVSPDGRRVAFDFLKVAGGGIDIWIYDVAQQTLSPLTLDGHADAPFWSPDGTEVGYRSSVPGAEGIDERRADFSGQAHRLVPATAVTSGGPSSYRAAWMPDGRTLLYVDSAGHLLSSPPEGNAPPMPVLGPNTTVDRFSLSPDGRWVAYDSDVSGSYQVYLAPVSGPGGRIQVSVSGGKYPVWTRDGAGIVYDVNASDNASDAWMLATVRTTPTLAVVSRRKFAEAGAYNAGQGFDTAPDGRIVAIRYGSSTNELWVMRFVTDWRRAFGVGK